MPPAPPITIMAALSVGVLLDGVNKRPNERIIVIGARGCDGAPSWAFIYSDTVTRVFSPSGGTLTDTNSGPGNTWAITINHEN